MQLFIVSGLIGSGKSTVSKLLKKKGFYYFDSDNIAKKLLRENNTIKAKLVKFFDKDILSRNKISIKKVKEKLLTSNKNREFINKTIHPIFFLYINSKLNKLKNLKVVLELPLIETAKNITAPFKIITIDSTYHKRMNRSLKSKKISKKDFTKLDKAQKNRSFYINKSNYILVNNDTMSSLKNKFEKLYLTKILKK